MEDNLILDLFFARDENAIRETEKKYSKLCFRISKNILGNDSDAEECLNDTYLALWNAIPPERPHSLLAYSAKIIRNISLKRLEHDRAQKRHSGDLIPLHELEEIIPDNAWYEEHGEEEIGTMIREFLLSEKEDARNIFMRKYFFFDSIEDIAKKYSFSESKVKSSLFHTRHRLKHYLKTKGVHV